MERRQKIIWLNFKYDKKSKGEEKKIGEEFETRFMSAD